MAKFVYKMQNLLNLKIKTEDQAKVDFGKAQKELNDQIDKANELIERRAQYMQEGLDLRKSEHLNVRDITDNQISVAQMDRIIAEQQMVVQEYAKRVEVERRKLNVAMQERKMHEKLRERALEEYLAEERKAEYLENDQRSSFIYGQKQNER